MTTGTKVFLALFALIVGTLVVYYGVVMPDNAGTGAEDKVASKDAGQAPEAADKNQPREPVDDSPTSGGKSTNQSEHRTSPPPSPPPRDPAPTAPILNQPQPAFTSGAGGLLSEAVREAAGGTGVGVGLGIDDLKVTPDGDPNANVGGNSNFIPLVGLNNGDLRNEGAGERSSEVESATVAPSAGAATTDQLAKTDPQPVTPGNQPQVQPEIGPAALPQPEPKPSQPAPSIPPARVEYLIAQGDTFTSIAESWFGDENKWSMIAKENPTVDPQKLKIGQRIFLPPKDAPVAAAKPEPVVAEGESIHVVQSGETLIAIARDHFGADAKWEDIYALNKSHIGNDPAVLKVGMKLKLPKK